VELLTVQHSPQSRYVLYAYTGN